MLNKLIHFLKGYKTTYETGWALANVGHDGSRNSPRIVDETVYPGPGQTRFSLITKVHHTVRFSWKRSADITLEPFTGSLHVKSYPTLLGGLAARLKPIALYE